MPEKNDKKQVIDGFQISDFFVRMQKQLDCPYQDIQDFSSHLIVQSSLLYLLHKLCHAVLIIDKPLRPLIDEHSFHMLIAVRRESFHALSILSVLFCEVHNRILS